MRLLVEQGKLLRAFVGMNKCEIEKDLENDDW